MTAIAPNGIFWSLQGEGRLRGAQMAFLRLAGCSVGCAQCDTNYSVAERLNNAQILERLEAVLPAGADRWIWITGGEPTDHDLEGIVALLHAKGWQVALATSGVRTIPYFVDWVSVSPHGGAFKQWTGHELKLIDGLNGLNLEDWVMNHPTDTYRHRYVQPLSVGRNEDPASLARCMEFLKKHPKWSLSRQDHVYWEVA